jgi:GxxExxY protein
MPEERDPQTYAIIGAAMEVHTQLGCGFLQAVYHEALVVEFELRGIPFKHELELPIHYKGRRLDCLYRADFVCFESIVVELKALKELGGVEESQIINYLKATKHTRGLLINFGNQRLQSKRFIHTPT